MIKKLYDFRQTAIPAALLQAEVTGDELAAELHLAAARFTTIASVEAPIEKGDVVALEFVSGEKVKRIYANVGKDFQDVESSLPGLRVGDSLQMPYAGKTVEAKIVSVKRDWNDKPLEKQVIASIRVDAQGEEYPFKKY